MSKTEAFNPKKTLKELKRVFKHLDIDKVEYKSDESCVTAIFNSSLKKYDDNIIARFEIHAKAALFGFTFDHLIVNEQTLRMVNAFNENNAFFVAYIDAAKNYLRLVHTVMILHEDDIYDYSLSVMREFISDELEPLLAPLCALSEGDQ